MVAEGASVAEPDRCPDARYIHAFDPALRAGPCTDIATLPVRNRHGTLNARVVRLSSVRGDTAAAVRELTDLARRVGAASDQIGLPLPDKLTILLDSEAPVAETRAASWARRVEDECTIAYHYTATAPRKLFQVAHDLFHCMQAKQWDDARLGSTDSDWWAEGSAELFASLAFAGSNLTDDDAAAFHAAETTPLISRSYDAVVFFDWFLATKGAAEVVGLLDGVHDQAGTGALRNLRDAVHKDDWVAFEEAYYDHHIAEPGGHALGYPDTPDPPVTRIDSSGTKTFSAEPYVVRRAIVEFAEGKKYELDRSGQSEKIIMQWSASATGAWAEPPSVVHACHQNVRFRAVIGTTDSSNTIRMRVTARDDHDCNCVVGNWQQTAESVARVSQRLAARGIRGATCSVTSGGTLLSLGADHSGADTYQDLTTDCTSRTISSHGVSSGALSFTWSATADQLQFTYTGSTAHTQITVSGHGHSTTQNAPIGGSGTTASAAMHCEGNQLHLEYSGDAYDYTRATSP